MKQKAKTTKFILIPSILIFALISVFGISLLTGDSRQSNVGISYASAVEPADINNDNSVNVFDLSILLGRWNTADDMTDLNNDGVVSVFDLSMMLSKWGAVGGTAQVVKPTLETTGPRQAITRTLTASDALSELRTTKFLSGVRILGPLKFSGSDGVDWIIEDSVIAGGLYAVQSYVSLTPFTGTKAQRPILRYVDIVGDAGSGLTTSSSAALYGTDIVVENADIYGARDGVKAGSRMDLINSWVHDLDHPLGAHSDAMQIVSGTDILIKGSRLDAYVGYSVDGTVAIGEFGSGALQTGTVSGDIQAVWENNWFAGGGYTIRGANSNPGNYVIDYAFRNNKWMRYGTSVVLNRSDLAPSRYGPLGDSPFINDGTNVWEDTGESVL